jgi:uncharacterized protein
MEQLEKRLAELLTSAALRCRTRLLILQGSPFCNIACDYCYLPARDDRRRMDHDLVARAVAWVYRNELAADDMTLVWHAGEPLVLPPSWYEEAFARISAVVPPGLLPRHALQTNGMLIDDAWCDFFLRHNISVGVSLDGPPDLHDAHRKTRAGKGTHAQAMHGIDVLRRRNVPFHVIAVVTERALDRPDDFVGFFLNNGLQHLGINIEEIEGQNRRSTLAAPAVEQRFRRFFERVIDRANASGCLSVREFWDTCNVVTKPYLLAGNEENSPFAIVSVSVDGKIATFSPELLGQSDARLGEFTVGHIDTTELADILLDPHFNSLHESIAKGVRACHASCPYFPVCGGGAPANKLGEHGSFSVTETMFCRLVKQQVTEVVLARLDVALARHPLACE